MNSKISAQDFFSIVEMLDATRVKLRMALITQKKIVGLAMGDQNYAQNNSPFPNILSGVHIIIDESVPANNVIIIADYKPHTSEFVEIEII